MNGVSKTIKNEAKEELSGFFSMFLVTLATSLLGSALAATEVIQVVEGTYRAGHDF